MRLSNCAAFLIVAALASPAAAQSSLAPDRPSEPLWTAPVETGTPGLGSQASDDLFRPRVQPRDRSFLQDVGGDFKRFFSNEQTLWTVSAFGVGALFASSWDEPAARAAHANWTSDAFDPGDLAGKAMTHFALGGGTYLVGRLTGDDTVAAVGRDILRVQILSQTVIQAAKFATQRERPDGSNHQSFPSGHTASAFATATVVQRHFGWKAGIPAYVAAGYIGASRMAHNKHHLSDVLIGAGIGLASAHTVTFGVGSTTFDMGVAPTVGGGAVTFSVR